MGAEQGKNSCKKLKFNNIGFSLIELLVAVCILAVAAIPMIRSFMGAYYSNSKSRERLSAMMVAEDVVEGLKGHSYEDVEKAFLSYNSADYRDFPLLAKGVVRGDTKVKAVSSDGLLQIEIENLHAQTTSFTADRKYDAIISINAIPYRTEGGASANIAYNSIPLSVIKNMNKYHDGVFFYNYPNDWIEAQDEIYVKHPDDYENADAVKMEDVSRLFILNITKPDKDATGGRRISVSANVRYYYAKGGTTINYSDPDFSKEYGVYDNIDTYDKGGSLRNIFFFYYPGYEYAPAAFNNRGQSGSVKKDDTIIINNEEDVPFTVYLAKQIRFDAGQVYSDEISYSPIVYINEGDVNSETDTDICSNFNVNIADGSSLGKETQKSEIFKFYEKNSEKTLATDYDPFKGLAQEAYDHIFDVKVEVFKPRDNSVDEADGIDRDKRLAFLDTSKID